MHSGSVAGTLEKRGVESTTPHLHKVESSQLYANEERAARLAAYQKLTKIFQTDRRRSEMKTDSAAAQPISRLKCFQEHVSVSYFHRESFETSRHYGQFL